VFSPQTTENNADNTSACFTAYNNNNNSQLISFATQNHHLPVAPRVKGTGKEVFNVII
jgi:uncharacterized protein YdhG (YjbR/CyaY superfamily)